VQSLRNLKEYELARQTIAKSQNLVLLATGAISDIGIWEMAGNIKTEFPDKTVTIVNSVEEPLEFFFGHEIGEQVIAAVEKKGV
jgi:hypothetical protein